MTIACPVLPCSFRLNQLDMGKSVGGMSGPGDSSRHLQDWSDALMRSCSQTSFTLLQVSNMCTRAIIIFQGAGGFPYSRWSGDGTAGQPWGTGCPSSTSPRQGGPNTGREGQLGFIGPSEKTFQQPIQQQLHAQQLPPRHAGGSSSNLPGSQEGTMFRALPPQLQRPSESPSSSESMESAKSHLPEVCEDSLETDLRFSLPITIHSIATAKVAALFSEAARVLGLMQGFPLGDRNQGPSAAMDHGPSGRGGNNRHQDLLQAAPAATTDPRGEAVIGLLRSTLACLDVILNLAVTAAEACCEGRWTPDASFPSQPRHRWHLIPAHERAGTAKAAFDLLQMALGGGLLDQMANTRFLHLLDRSGVGLFRLTIEMEN